MALNFLILRTGKQIQLYMDASLLGLGGFFYKINANFWLDCTSSIPQSQAFGVPIFSVSHINIHELEAILLAIEAWGLKWAKSQLILYTDSITAFDGLTHHIFRGAANFILWKILLLATQYNIAIKPRWLSSNENGLANALSRFSESTVTNLCTH